MAFIVIYITNENEAEATKISQQLLDEKLVACANIFPISSAYWWKGQQEQSQEFVALVKTRTENWEAVCKKTEQLHPYDTPCIMKWEVEANASYEAWILEQTILAAQ